MNSLRQKLTVAGLACLGLGAALVFSASSNAGAVTTVDWSEPANHASYWENYFGNDVSCEKFESDDEWVDESDDSKLNVGNPPAGQEWYAIVLKAGQYNDIFYSPADFEAGSTIQTGPNGPEGQHQAISHYFRCFQPEETTSSTASTSSTTSTTADVLGSTIVNNSTDTTVAEVKAGSLARTGRDSAVLFAIGLALLSVGAALRLRVRSIRSN